MRINLTKKEIVNNIYMQIGYSKNISEILVEDILNLIIQNIKKHKIVKLSNFGTFKLRQKKAREGRNPKTKEVKLISARYVFTFKPSKDFKEYLNEI